MPRRFLILSREYPDDQDTLPSDLLDAPVLASAIPTNVEDQAMVHLIKQAAATLAEMATR